MDFPLWYAPVALAGLGLEVMLCYLVGLMLIGGSLVCIVFYGLLGATFSLFERKAILVQDVWIDELFAPGAEIERWSSMVPAKQAPHARF